MKQSNYETRVERLLGVPLASGVVRRCRRVQSGGVDSATLKTSGRRPTNWPSV